MYQLPCMKACKVYARIYMGVENSKRESVITAKITKKKGIFTIEILMRTCYMLYSRPTILHVCHFGIGPTLLKSSFYMSGASNYNVINGIIDLWL